MANLSIYLIVRHFTKTSQKEKLADVGLEVSGDGVGGPHISRHRWGDLRPVLSFPQHTELRQVGPGSQSL
jgi:hypothetical protein